MFNKTLLSLCVGASVLGLCSCSSTTYDTELKTDFVDRKSLEQKSADEISSQSIDIKQMKDEKKLAIGVVLKVSDMSQGRAKLPDSAGLADTAYGMAQNFLAQTKSYKVYVLPPKVKSDDLMSGKDFNGIKYAFLIDMNVVLTSEIEERLDIDEAMYKTTIDWKLIDNRTKSNGLGKLEAPTIKESLVCRALTTRKLKISSVRGNRMGGSEIKNAQNAYFNTLMNSLFQFRAQLSNRIPFGGKIVALRLRDGKLRMTLRAGRDQGVVPQMQMLIINEEGDQVAIGTATGGASSDKTTINIWRWLSPSLEKSITAVAGDKKKCEEWLEEDGNALYAICLGTPKPSKDEISNFNDTK